MTAVRPFFVLLALGAAAVAPAAWGASQSPSGNSRAVVVNPVTGSAIRTVQLPYVKLSPSDPNFKAFWTLDPHRIDIKGYPPTAYVGQVREASGALLTVTMLEAPEECGPNLCSMKIIRDGKTVKEFVACDDPADHRVSIDGKYLLLCDTTIQIPQ